MEINIIGMGKGKELAPLTGIRWGITRVIHSIPVDVLFDMHDLDNLSFTANKLFIERMEACERTDTTFFSCHEIKSDVSVRYPIEKIIEEFGSTFFTDSCCYALAMAIFYGPDTINLYGINQAKSNAGEYQRNKPGTDFWVGVAIGRGITVNIHGDLSEVCKTFDRKMYGYGTPQGEYVGSLQKRCHCSI